MGKHKWLISSGNAFDSEISVEWKIFSSPYRQVYAVHASLITYTSMWQTQAYTKQNFEHAKLIKSLNSWIKTQELE